MLSIGNNRKLKAGKIATFNLPAMRSVCDRECVGCYAKKSQRMYKAVLPFRMMNYTASMLPDFASLMAAEITKSNKRVAAIRVHESGEFYHQNYVDKWADIARRCPDSVFYAYTKRINDFNMQALLQQPNFTLIDSRKYGELNYGDPALVATQKAQGAYVCPATKGGVSCNNGCNYCLTKRAQATGVVFHKH